jgi:hypothetical protein
VGCVDRRVVAPVGLSLAHTGRSRPLCRGASVVRRGGTRGRIGRLPSRAHLECNIRRKWAPAHQRKRSKQKVQLPGVAHGESFRAMRPIPRTVRRDDRPMRDRAIGRARRERLRVSQRYIPAVRETSITHARRSAA